MKRLLSVGLFENRAASKPLDVFLRSIKAEMKERVAFGCLNPALKCQKETFVKIKDHFGSMLLSVITPTEIDNWLKRMPVSQRTRERHRSYAVQIFNRRNWQSW